MERETFETLTEHPLPDISTLLDPNNPAFREAALIGWTFDINTRVPVGCVIRLRHVETGDKGPAIVLQRIADAQAVFNFLSMRIHPGQARMLLRALKRSIESGDFEIDAMEMWPTAQHMPPAAIRVDGLMQFLVLMTGMMPDDTRDGEVGQATMGLVGVSLDPLLEAGKVLVFCVPLGTLAETVVQRKETPDELQKALLSLVERWRSRRVRADDLVGLAWRAVRPGREMIEFTPVDVIPR